MASLSTTDIDNLTKSLLSNDNFLTIIQNVTPNAQPQAHRNTTRRPHQDLNSEMNSLFTTPSTRSRNTTRRRTQDNSRSRSCSNSRQNQNYFYLKEVILLDTSQSDQIPRANYYGKLDEKGHVYHHVELEQCMTAKEVYKKLENMFSDILEIESDPNKFEFMIGMGSRLTKLRLTDDQERNAQLLHRLYGNKRVYLLPSRDIVSTTNSNISDYLLPLSPTSDAKESDTEVVDSIQCVNCYKMISSTEKHHCNGGSSQPRGANECSRQTLDLSNKQSVRSYIYEMFPNQSTKSIEDALNLADVNDAIDLLTSNISKEECIKSFKKKCLEETEHLQIRRNELWRDGVLFYKKSLAEKSMLTKKLCIEFTGEEGVDGGALSIDFFDTFFKESINRLFDKTDVGFIPNRSGNNLVPFKILGLAISHSLLHGGPPFPNLPMWAYLYIAGKPEEEIDSILSGHQPKEIIPLIAATANLLAFLNGLDNCKSTEEIDNLMDESAEGPAYEQLINSSQWPVECKISIENVETLKSMLIRDEVVGKREKQLRSIRDGLQYTELMPFIERCDEMCSIFLMKHVDMTPELMVDIVEWDTLENVHKEKEWLREAINEMSCQELTCMLKFCTSFTQFDNINKPRIYLEKKDDRMWPESSVCTSTLFLPLGYTNKDEFKSCIKSAFKYGHEGFGRL